MKDKLKRWAAIVEVCANHKGLDGRDDIKRVLESVVCEMLEEV